MEIYRNKSCIHFNIIMEIISAKNIIEHCFLLCWFCNGSRNDELHTPVKNLLNIFFRNDVEVY